MESYPAIIKNTRANNGQTGKNNNTKNVSFLTTPQKQKGTEYNDTDHPHQEKTPVARRGRNDKADDGKGNDFIPQTEPLQPGTDSLYRL